MTFITQLSVCIDTQSDLRTRFLSITISINQLQVAWCKANVLTAYHVTKMSSCDGSVFSTFP